MDTKKSEFFHFGILPSVCIHSVDEDDYSSMYAPQEKCKCGCSEWREGTMKMFENSGDYVFPVKRVHRCCECNELRMSHHIGVKDGIGS